MPPKEDYSVKEVKPNIQGGIGPRNHKLTLVEETLYLYVKVVGARNVPLNPETGTCHPFVELKAGNYLATTMPVPNTIYPIWNQVFAFTKDRLQGKTLEILLKDKTTPSKGFIGKITVAVGDVSARLPWDSSLAEEWNKLEGQNGIIGDTELMLAIWIGNQADDAFLTAWRSDAAGVSAERMQYTRPKMYRSPRHWYLRVKLIEAQDLIPFDFNRKLEVYVKATLGTLVLKTKVSSNKSVNPSWNEELMFVAAEPFEDPLILSVEDKIDDNKQECLGRIVMPLQKVEKRLLPPAPGDKWINLERYPIIGGEKKEVKFASKLHVLVYLDGVYHVFDEPANSCSDLKATSPKLKPGEIGILELGILKADGLVQMKKSNDGLEITDAYCVAKYGPRWARTRTIVNSVAPKWNEQFKWDVYDPCTVITIGVFDNSNLREGSGEIRDSIIGKVRIRLSTLKTDKIYAHSYPLLALRPNGLMKMGELHLVVRFTCISMANLLHAYTQPLFPKTQYTSPLSVYQLNSLRSQAVFHIQSRLLRADPPLQQEVVEYMLDARTRGWSIRRARANFERIQKCLEGFALIWKWFDGIRQWKNSMKTVSIWFLFLILIIYPELILPNLSFYMSIVGLKKYRNRPKNPAFMDIKLSKAEEVSPDDLDEELDTFPSSRNEEVVRMRYERLRGIGGMIAGMLGELATQLERVQALLSWRDPRATPMFVTVCTIVGIILYLIPFKWLLAVGVTYVMRPPRLRVTLPPIPQNFIRRMPAKEDSLL